MSVAISIYKSYNIHEIAEMVHRTMRLATQSGRESIAQHPVYLDLSKEGEAYVAAIGQRYSSGLGKTLTQLDERRDKIHANMFKIIRAFATLNLESQKQAAETLLARFNQWGSVRNLAYAEETAILRKLIESLEPHSTELDALSLTHAFAELVKTQRQFEALTEEKHEKYAEIHQQSSASSLRYSILKKLRTFCDLAETMANFDEVWQSFYAELEEALKTL